MKRSKIALWCLVIACIAAAFTLGFFLGSERMQAEQELMILVQKQTENETVVNQEPEKETETQPDEQSSTSTEEVVMVNINTADFDQLQTLPGIGPVLAQRILDYRNAFGDFVAKEQLMEVSGIGEARYTELEPLITLE